MQLIATRRMCVSWPRLARLWGSPVKLRTGFPHWLCPSRLDTERDEAMQYGAIAVFVDRARLVDTRFVLTDHNAPIVAEICRHLDGIPLAIELAAARVKVLSIPNLAQRLNERFKLLTGGSRAALPRQKTLGALIDWSYGLLADEEQLLFIRLGIFAGEFGLDAALAVCGDGFDEMKFLDLITSLTDKSLVVADTSAAQSVPPARIDACVCCR